MGENAKGTTWWLDRTEPLEANGEIVTYMQMIPENDFEILSIAVITGNCKNKTFIIRQIADFKKNGINVSNESPDEKVTPLKGTIGSNILNHVCKLSGM